MDGIQLSGLEGKVAVVTGGGRMRSIGRPIAVEMAKAGCKVIVTGSGRSPEHYPDDEKEAGWKDVASVEEEIRAVGGTAIGLASDVGDEASSNRGNTTHHAGRDGLDDAYRSQGPPHSLRRLSRADPRSGLLEDRPTSTPPCRCE